jgi:hypothetical protein
MKELKEQTLIIYAVDQSPHLVAPIHCVELAKLLLAFWLLLVPDTSAGLLGIWRPKIHR